MKIVSLLASATEIAWALGLGDSIVAISHECDYPPEVLESDAAVLSLDAHTIDGILATILDGVEILAALLYPDAFSDVELEGRGARWQPLNPEV